MPDAMVGSAEADIAQSPRRKFSRSAFSWSMYEGGRDPYISIGGTMFMPYLATILAQDAVHGQELIAQIGVIAGVACAISAPLLGAASDRLGRRKPWLALLTALVLPVIACLWFVAPDGRYLDYRVVMVMTASVTVLFAVGDVFYGAMLPYAARSHERGKASGLALSLGSLFSFFITLFMLWAFVLPGKATSAFLPSAPLLGLDPSEHEPERIFGPIMALLFFLCALPLFFFSHDAPRLSTSFSRAVREGIGVLVAFFSEPRRYKIQMQFLGARTLAQDAANGLALLSGVYVAGVMNWSVTHMLVFGLLMTCAGVIGGGFGAWLCDTFGSKRAYQTAIAGTIIGLLGQLSVGSEHILFLVPASEVPLWSGPIFTRPVEIFMLVATMAMKISSSAGWASSRALLTELAPPGQIGAFYGLAIVAGTGSGWLAPLLVGMFTAYFSSLQGGFVPIIVLLILGFMILSVIPATHPRSEHT